MRRSRHGGGFGIVACGLLVLAVGEGARAAGGQASPEVSTVAGFSYWLQVASRTSGLRGSEWRTEVSINNPGGATATIEISFYPVAGGGPLSLSAQAPAGGQTILDDVVGRMGGGGNGALEVQSDVPVVVTSRTYDLIAPDAVCSPGGTFGQYYAAYASAAGLATGESALVPHLSENASHRTNLALTNTGEAPATVGVELFDGAGSELGQFFVDVPPRQFRQETRVFANRAGQVGLDNAFVRIMVVSGAGVIASASVVDNRTNGPTTIPAVPAEVSTEEETTVDLPGSVPMALVRIPAGTFTMGSPETERGRYVDEGPPHEVTITRAYYIGKTEVTQRQWAAVMGTNPSGQCGSYGIGADYPVYCVSWDDIAGPGGFIERLNQLLGTNRYRLPSEAEWERAARAGTTSPFSFGDDASCSLEHCDPCPLFDDYMWWCGNYSAASHPVARKRANAFGLHDMHGNLAEWVEDWYAPYPSSSQTDPTGPTSGSRRVVRGGAFGYPAEYCRSASRGSAAPGYRDLDYGFRVAASPDL
jgi:formylglycine-generating enzyme required for sulfatase activity